VRPRLLEILRNPVKAFFAGAIRLYQSVISPAIPGRCKYYPSCSQYALDAVREYGAARGFVLGVWRVLRCNPLSYGGYDPVSRQKLFRSRGVGACEAAAAAGETIVGEAIAREAAAGHDAIAGQGCHADHGQLVRG
jgi:uncharacterized protein